MAIVEPVDVSVALDIPMFIVPEVVTDEEDAVESVDIPEDCKEKIGLF